MPLHPGERYIEWDPPDPKDRPLDEVRAIRDDIAHRIDSLPPIDVTEANERFAPEISASQSH
jgi:hypothetical protein